MIYTVTLNPAIDRSIYIRQFETNKVNRIECHRDDPGGKGINVSKMIQKLCGKSIAIMIVGGESGHHLVKSLKEEGLQLSVFYNDEPTRVNMKVVDTTKHTFTDINEPGPQVKKGLLEDIELYLKNNLVSGDVIVFAGSLPKGVPNSIYRTWSQLCRDMGVKVILDADKDVLKEGILGKPHLIKPNQDELEAYFGVTFTSQLDMVEKARELIHQGLEAIVISQGKDGCLCVTEDDVIKYEPLPVEVKSTVGAGDSMVAALAYGLDINQYEDNQKKWSLQSMLSLGVAASSASIELEGTQMGTKVRIDALKEKVVFHRLTVV